MTTPYRQVSMAQAHDRCPKCGWEGSPLVRYRKPGECLHGDRGYTEHLDAACPCCGYEWRKECLKLEEVG